MIWLSWRQFRAQAATAWLAVAAAVAVLALTGPRIASLASTGQSVFDALTSTDRTLFYTGAIVVAIAPALIGAFLGAPLVAREIEAGTHRLAWSQSVTRRRWLASKLVLGVLVSAVSVGALSLAVTWWAEPLDGATSSTRGALPLRLTPVTFAMRGIVPVGYAGFALMLGVGLGLLLRRTVPAMALTLVVFTAVQIAVPLWVRPHLIPPEQATVSLSPRTLDGISLDGSVPTLSVHTANHEDWIIRQQLVGPAGKAAAVPGWFPDCLPGPSGGAGRARGSTDDDCLARLTAAGYRQEVTYQPASRFWPLQWLEFALFTVLTGVLAAVNLVLLRRAS